MSKLFILMSRLRFLEFASTMLGWVIVWPVMAFNILPENPFQGALSRLTLQALIDLASIVQVTARIGFPSHFEPGRNLATVCENATKRHKNNPGFLSLSACLCRIE
jgi:hypothetical protein